MTADLQYVGQNAVPLQAGASNAPIADATVDGLLSYLAFWTQHALGAAVAQLGSPVLAPVADVCPTGNRYAFDPGALHQQCKRPALFVWWDGASTIVDRTLVFSHRVRTIKALYVFDAVKQVGLPIVRGLIGSLDAAWCVACDRGSHPSYQGGRAIWDTLNLFGLSYQGGREGFLKDLVGESARVGVEDAATFGRGGVIDAAIQRGFPALEATFQVEERLGPLELVDGDAMPDMTATIRTNENGDTDTVPILDGILDAPDGAPGEGP